MNIATSSLAFDHLANMAYVALGLTQKQIGFLNLHAGKAAHETTCNFSIISPDNHETEYEALSHIWGNVTESRRVLVECDQMPVTDNLWQT